MGGKVIIIYSESLKGRNHLTDIGVSLSELSKYIWNKFIVD
jgi:hypothetical protein